MKISIFLIVFASLQSFALSNYAQTKKIDMKISGASIVSILQEIENDSEFLFFYNNQIMNLNKKVTIDLKNKTINEILDAIFEETDIKYMINNRQIILYNKDMGITLNQQQQIVSGKVTDSSGVLLPGVTVIVKGTNNGTITDSNGNYSISNVSEKETLQFTFVGMKSQEIIVGSKTTVNVIMEEVIIGLDDVIIVGYGTQKRINITGSVSNINSKVLDSKNVAKGSLALVGELSGVSVRQLSGNPRNNSAVISIRGLGTFSSAGNNPLILVDGIESSIDNVNPNDIKSVSVLKDAASASIYGSKAANGVILVETKKGISGPPKFSYYDYFGKQQAATLPQMCDSWDYAAAINEALTNMGQSKRFTDEEIQKFKSGTDPSYPNFNHMKNLWTSGSGFQSKHGISISGGNPSTKYLFSTSYLDQEGIVEKNFTKRYDIRLNLNTKLKDNINLSVSFSGNNYKGREPSGAYGIYLQHYIDWLSLGALRLSNNIPEATPDGYWGANEVLHPEADLNSPSFAENKNTFMFGTTDLSWNISKDLLISTKAGYTSSFEQDKYFRAEYPVTPTYSVSPNFLSVNWSNNTALTLQSLIEYNRQFGNHSVHILGGFSQQHYYYSSVSAYRDQFPNNEIFEIDAGSTVNGTQGGNATENKLRSFFGRVNYSYLDKYLLEANIRYDGSSRFPKKDRFGSFPSISAGWRISNENFFKNSVSWINDLKIRGSWGELGNQSVGDYPYQSLISLGQNYPFGNSISAGAAVTTLPNINISWERTTMTDAGIDISVIDNKLALTADYFVKTTFDILYNVSASTILGARPSADNAGTVENRGWNFDLSYKNNLENLSYSVSTNLSFVNNKVLKLANVNQDIGKGLFVGYPIGSSYGFVADGIFVDDADVQSYAKQPFNAAPGEIRYKDISGPNGVPDGKVDKTYDRKVIGSPLPTSTYGLNLAAKYKGFDINILLQGESGRKERITLPFFQFIDNNDNIQKWQYQQRWTIQNPNRNAGYPRLFDRGEDFFTNNPSTFWFKNASFLRLKNLQIGYTLPSSLTEKVYLNNVRFNISGENLFTLNNFYEGWDPEMQILGSWTGAWYPPTRLWSFGINIDF